MRAPRNVSGGHAATDLQEHYANPSPTVAICVKIVPLTGSTIGFTSHDHDILISGVTYRTVTGVAASQLETATGAHAANLELTTILSANGITEAELNTPKWSAAAFEVFLVNYEDLTMGEEVYAAGKLGQFKIHVPLTATVEAMGHNNALLNQIGRLIEPLCDADFGDARCGLNLVSLGFVHTGKLITTVTSTLIFRVASLVGVGADYFTNGHILVESGSNSGLGKFEVKSFDNANGEFVLQRAAPYTLTTSDTITATRGCRKRAAEDCAAAFSNILNFRGFNWIPLEKAMRIVEG